MKLTDSQIEKLYNFTQKHYVEWYDVQTELVDHLANGIETQWQENPNTSFEDALKTEFKKFGVMGFGDVVEERTKALNKTYWRLIWKNFKGFFKLPKIILTLFLIWAYYTALSFSMQYHTNWVVIPTLTVLFGFPWYFWIKEFKRSRRLKKQTGKKWLFDNTISQLGGLVHVMNFAIYFQVFYQNKQVWPVSLSVIFSICAVLIGMLIYIAVYVVTPKLRNEMAQHNPEYNFV
ncbi:hypothetical protein [Winogradskyella luteola]|uniref:Uncharacterized protein n=1 Tax=Winogradskyella luteola TaxID=2828330 RepID=A0A9X1F8A5_9FLAO|nr:hypothetical protein [Winogradskyella luteola]MBV7269187.1 hypothetical protein [Winogradskyella luteola]